MTHDEIVAVQLARFHADRQRYADAIYANTIIMRPDDELVTAMDRHIAEHADEDQEEYGDDPPWETEPEEGTELDGKVWFNGKWRDADGPAFDTQEEEDAFLAHHEAIWEHQADSWRFDE